VRWAVRLVVRIAHFPTAVERGTIICIQVQFHPDSFNEVGIGDVEATESNRVGLAILYCLSSGFRGICSGRD
jgi:hypothetical protein